MDIDLPALSEFLSRPIRAVQVALPKSLEGRWPWESPVRTHFAAIRTDQGALLLHFAPVASMLLDGIEDDDPNEGLVPAGNLILIGPNDTATEREALEHYAPFEHPDSLEMIDLHRLFPDAGRAYVEGATAFEISFRQLIRNSAFLVDVSGIRIYSPEASTLIEHGSGGVLECSIRS